MSINEKYMSRCIEIARQGAGAVSPNPMVGCVIVNKGEIIGEGFHQKYGQAHAEVNAINAVAKKELLKTSTLFVSLEPCAHHGLTPPCSDLIIKNKIPSVVIGTVDSFAKVAGKGIEKLKNAGIAVETGMLENECRDLNKRFFTFYEKNRPYVILKWAQTQDGFIDIDRTEKDFGEPTWITGAKALSLVHKMRAEEDAIMVGTNTARKDNPTLTVRHCKGKNPVRIVLDRELKLPQELNLFNEKATTLIFNSIENKVEKNNFFIQINFSKAIVPQILTELFARKIQSVIIEGGKQLLESFIEINIWDEAHVFTGNKIFAKGIKAPLISGIKHSHSKLGDDHLSIFKNTFKKQQI